MYVTPLRRHSGKYYRWVKTLLSHLYHIGRRDLRHTFDFRLKWAFLFYLWVVVVCRLFFSRSIIADEWINQ
jgi:hypothetical protein